MSFIVAIDGPAGTGKGTVTPALAKKFNLMYMDTGATYRCVTLRLLNEKVDFKDTEKIKEILKNIKIDFDEKNNFFLDGKDVTDEIRSKKVTENVSQVSHLLEVRLAMVDLQRKLSEGKNVILEGRDIGTNVFPNADVKIYLDASVEERVKRRIKQNKEKGVEMTEDEVRENIIFRDTNDKNNEIAPLKQAKDAVYVDSSNLTINQVINKISKIIKKAKVKHDRMENGYIMTKETPFKKLRRKLVKGILALSYHIVYRVEKIGEESIDTDEGLIICSKHVNSIDAAGIVLLNKRYIRFIAKHDLFRFRSLSHLGHLFNIIPVKRNTSDLKSIKMCLKALKDKEALGIFPEGTRNGIEKNVDVKNGAAFLAYKAKVKIVPVGISGSFKPFTKVVFNYGKPIDVNAYKTDDPNWMDKATEEITKQIIELSKPIKK